MSNEEAINELPSLVDSPKDYLMHFRDSEIYKNAYSDFYEHKSLAEDVSAEEKLVAFEEDETCRKTLVDFVKRDDVTLKYSPEFYTDGFKDNINHYFALIRDFDKGGISDRDGVLAYDKLRGQYHNAAARFLSDSMDISHRLARGFIQVMAVQKGLETLDSAGQDERKRFKAMLN